MLSDAIFANLFEKGIDLKLCKLWCEAIWSRKKNIRLGGQGPALILHLSYCVSLVKSLFMLYFFSSLKQSSSISIVTFHDSSLSIVLCIKFGLYQKWRKIAVQTNLKCWLFATDLSNFQLILDVDLFYVFLGNKY